MDEILFHASQRLEAFQVYLLSGFQNACHIFHDYSEQIQNTAVEVWASPQGMTLQAGLNHGWQTLQDLGSELKKNANPELVYKKLLQFLGTNVAGVNVYYGCVGFIIGGALGVTVGLSWRRFPSPVPRMKGIVCNRYCGLDALQFSEDLPVPAIKKSDEILVQVRAASVDPIDIEICSGYGRVIRKHTNRYNPNVKNDFPVVLGRDCSGIIVEIGQDVTKFEIGDEVWFTVPFWSPGTLAEFVVVKEQLIAKKPKGIRFEIAASVPYSGSVAWNALCYAGLDAKSAQGKRVLVHSGCTAIGVIVMQLARLWGAHVTTICPLRAVPVTQALGADSIITSDGDFEKRLTECERFDFVFNTVGMGAHEMCLKLCNSEGLVVSAVASRVPSDEYGFLFGLLFSLWFRMKCLIRWTFRASTYGIAEFRPNILDALGSLIENGSLQPVVDKIFSPQDAEVAFHHVDSVDAIGKTVIRFRNPNTLRSHHTFGKKRTRK